MSARPRNAQTHSPFTFFNDPRSVRPARDSRERERDKSDLRNPIKWARLLKISTTRLEHWTTTTTTARILRSASAAAGPQNILTQRENVSSGHFLPNSKCAGSKSRRSDVTTCFPSIFPIAILVKYCAALDETKEEEEEKIETKSRPAAKPFATLSADGYRRRRRDFRLRRAIDLQLPPTTTEKVDRFWKKKKKKKRADKTFPRVHLKSGGGGRRRGAATAKISCAARCRAFLLISALARDTPEGFPTFPNPPTWPHRCYLKFNLARPPAPRLKKKTGRNFFIRLK